MLSALLNAFVVISFLNNSHSDCNMEHACDWIIN